MPSIVLTTFNAKYIHAAFGLRYLHANLGPLAADAAVLEFDINQRTGDVLEKILAAVPIIVGVGVYIWNIEQATKLVADLKRVRPGVIVVIGGPEVSHETEGQEIVALADYVVRGEADSAFAALCETLLRGRKPLMKVIDAALPGFSAAAPGGLAASDAAAGNDAVKLPYHLYTDTDLAHRVLYVEASRGCPFKCEFCLSSLDVPVRNAPLQPFLAAMQDLLDRGAKQFKFVDRTFNLNLDISSAILRFFLERLRPGLFLHFEMIPDRLPLALRELIKQFPAGALQFEVGVQTLNPDVEKLISRRQDHKRLEENLKWLRTETGVHVHADLIVGLPGEDIASFSRGFDRLLGFGPQEIQVGMLKRLRGTPIARHSAAWEMIYSPHAPYEVLQTKLLGFNDLQRMRRFARYWDLIANSGNFVETTTLLTSPTPINSSAATLFLHFSDWLFATTGQTHAIALTTLAGLVFDHLTQVQIRDRQAAADAIWADYQRVGRSDRPAFLRDLVAPADTRKQKKPASRQERHLGNAPETVAHNAGS